MQMLEVTPGSSKASDFPVLLPANNVPDQSIKLAVLASTGKSKKELGAQLFPAQVKRHSDKNVKKANLGSNTSETLMKVFYACQPGDRHDRQSG